MADRIMIDTVLLGDLQGQLRQLQRSLTTVNGKVVLSVSEVQRVASGQDAIIRKLQSIQRNVQKTADRTERLSRAVRDAVENWEEVEKKIASQKLPESADAGKNEDSSPVSSGESSHGTGNKPAQGNWIPGWLKKILKSTPLGPAIWAGEIADIMAHLLRGEDYISGSINELGWEYGGESGIKAPGASIYTDAHGELSIWDNDLVSITWQDVEIFGKKMRVPVPYINIGRGVSENPVSVGVGGEAQGETFHADVSAATGYAGSLLEIGFKDGEFVFHIGGGANITAVTTGVQEGNKYMTVGTSIDSAAAGAVGSLDYREGVVSGSISIAWIEGADLNFTFNIGEWAGDLQKTVDDFTHGDFQSAAERALDLAFINTEKARTILDFVSNIF